MLLKVSPLAAFVCLLVVTSPCRAQRGTEQLNRTGLRCFKKKDFACSRKMFEASIKVDPANPVARYYLARSLTKLGEKEQALQHWEGVLKQKIPDRVKQEATEVTARLRNELYDEHLSRARKQAQDAPEKALSDVRVALRFKSTFAAHMLETELLQRTGDLDGAMAVLAELKSRADLRPQQRARVEAALKAVQSQKPVGVEIRTPGVEGVQILVDGQPVEPTFMKTPGTYQVVVRRAGYEQRSETLVVQPGTPLVRTFTLEKKSRTTGLLIATYVTAGLGVALIATGGAFHYLAGKEYSTANDTKSYQVDADSAWDKTQRNATIAQVMYGLGGAALAASVTCLVIELVGRPSSSGQASFGMTPTHRGGAVTFQMSF